MTAIIFSILLLLTIVFSIRFGIKVYNQLIYLSNMIQRNKSNVEIQLKRRFAVINNMLTVAREYASHEKITLSEVIDNRNPNKHRTIKGVRSIVDPYASIAESVKSLYRLTENYPDLKANQNFEDLNNQLQEVESDLLKYREYYNNAVNNYNNIALIFPNNIIAILFNFKKKEFFELDEESRIKLDEFILK